MNWAALVGWLAAGILAALVLLVLFEPSLPYRTSAPASSVDSPRFLAFLGAIVDARPFDLGETRVLSSGAELYAAQLRDIGAARRSVHLEVYLFLRGKAGDEMLAALTERAQSGVAVRIVVDRIGSLSTPDSYFDSLRAAGGRVLWYQPIAWYTLKRLNNRTHRDILVIDGEVGFVGGVGIADFWIDRRAQGAPWRDTAIRASGDFARGLQTSFAENWLEASGEVLPENEFPPETRPEAAAAKRGGIGLVVNSTPSAGRSSRARMLFQLLLASARESIQITSPYFVPDRSLIAELCKARLRGVAVSVLTPNRFNNHPVTRLASRRRYGRLLAAGVHIHEYQPAMIHAKVLIVDGQWSVLGSTNFDSRSFGLNDEVNIAMLSAEVSGELGRHFAQDLSQSVEITPEDWKRRSLLEKVAAGIGRLLERQE